MNRAIVGLSSCLLCPATTLFAAANLYITKTGPGGVQPGEQIVYTIEVGNAGPDAVRDAVVTDVEPPGLTPVSVSGDCSSFQACTLALAPGATASITATYLVPPTYAGADPIVNTASVMSQSDTFLSDNMASVSTALTRVQGFYTLPPCRVADTRGPVGVPIGGPALAAGEQRPIGIRERCGLPGNAIGVSFNITITQPTSAGNLRLYPQGEPSLSSVINYVSGQTRANNGIVKIAASGAIVVQCDQAIGSSVHFILDVNGYFASSDQVATPKGKNVRIRPAPEVEITFDDVTTGGSTSARVIEFLDDRPPSVVDKDLRDFFPAGSPERALLPSVIIPSFVQGLPKGGPNGPPTFVLAIIDTDAAFARTAEFHGFEDFRLGWDPSCVDTVDPTREPRTFYAREAPKSEPFLVEELPYENPVFVDISSGCGSNKGTGWNFSLYLTGRDARAPLDVAFFMLTSLDQVLSTLGNLITNRVVAANLLAEVQNALGILDVDPPAARASMDAFIGIVDGNPGAFDNSTRNISGELVARAQAARYMIGKIP